MIKKYQLSAVKTNCILLCTSAYNLYFTNAQLYIYMYYFYEAQKPIVT